jgi:8-oxo-dGTP pyrophosphatase MutT (NUDIX family)
MTLRLSIIQRLDAEATPTRSNNGILAIDDLSLNPGTPRAERELTPAAVLIPLVERPDGLSVLLTQRTDHLYDHAGQVSFPGGRVEAQDVDVIDTALRETEEEIGLARSYVEILGQLDAYETITGFRIYPVVGLVRPGFTLELDAFEVAAAFEIPLALALSPENYERRSREHLGARRHFYVLAHDERFIWGATAGMLFNLGRRLAGLLDQESSG